MQLPATWASIVVALVGIAGIVVMEVYAASQGINGVALAAAFAGVAAITSGFGSHYITKRRERSKDSRKEPDFDPADLFLPKCGRGDERE